MTEDLNVQKSLGSLVAERPQRSRVLERFGLDYCCGGKRSLSEACDQKGVNAIEVLRELNETDLEADKRRHLDGKADWTNASMSQLVDHIEQTHHAYMKTEMQRLLQLANKVAEKHGSKRPVLLQLADVFAAFSEQMSLHMMKEDTVLFPMIKQLENATGLPEFHCGGLVNPIRVMEFEHDEAGAVFNRIATLTNVYTLPEDACNSYRALFNGLQEMEADLHMHVHKENNILFPAAMKAEEKLRRSVS